MFCGEMNNLPFQLLPVGSDHSGLIHLTGSTQVSQWMPFLTQPGFQPETAHMVENSTATTPPGQMNQNVKFFLEITQP